MRLAARSLSYVLHPLLMPLVTLWVLLTIDPQAGYFIPAESRWMLFAMVGVMTILFPLVSMLFMLRAGLVSSLELPRREERIAPYLMTLLYSGMALYLLFRTPLHPIAYALFIGILCAITLSTIITIRWKISAHMVGIGGLLGLLFAVQFVHGIDLFLPIAACILLAGLLGTARLLTSDHSLAQVFVGALIGVGCTFLSILAPAIL